MRNKKQGFTLVELIVVIVILAILATIAFLSFSSQSASARDSTRLADMSNISKGLGVYNATSGIFPKPDSNSIAVTASGAVIGYQGYAGTNVLAIAKLSSNGGKDPLDGTFYTYSITADLQKMQLLGFLEDGSSALAYSPKFLSLDDQYSVNADPSSYSGRYSLTKGDQVGVILNSGSMTPIQTSYNAGSFTGVDIARTNSSYTIQLNNRESFSGTGGAIFTSLYNRRADLIQNKTLAASDSSLIGYWDMETLSGGKLSDMTLNLNDGALGGGGISVGSSIGNGKNGKSTSFTGSSYASISNFPGMNKITVASWIKSNGTANVYQRIATRSWANVGSFALMLQNNKPFFGVDQNVANEQYNAVSPSVIDNQWHFLVGVYDGAKVSIYVDGISKSSISAPTGALLSGTVSIGSTSGQEFNGLVDEVRIYNRNLSESEIQTLYNSSK